MLRVDCKECYDLVFEDCTNEKCIDGTIEVDENQLIYVNVYRITRHFGGQEEGGWWYDWYECIEVVPCKNKHSETIKEELEKQYASMKHGNISSVNGGVDIVVYIQAEMKQSETKERPYYE